MGERIVGLVAPKFSNALLEFFKNRGLDDNESYMLTQGTIGFLLGSDEIYTRAQVETLLNCYREELESLRGAR